MDFNIRSDCALPVDTKNDKNSLLVSVGPWQNSLTREQSRKVFPGGKIDTVPSHC